MPCPNTHASWNKLKKSVPVTWFELRPINLSAALFQVRMKPLESVDKDYVSGTFNYTGQMSLRFDNFLSQPYLLCYVLHEQHHVLDLVPTRRKEECCSNIP